MNERYSVVQDPCGVYFIWDEAAIEPVMAGSDIMAFVTLKEANRAVLRLNGPANDDRPANAAPRARLSEPSLFARPRLNAY